MMIKYYYVNDLNRLYNASICDKSDGRKHHIEMMKAHDNLEAYIQKLEHWEDTALQLSKNNGKTQEKLNALEADYVISNRELLIKQVEIERLQARVQELEAVNEDQALTISQNDYAYTIDKEMMEKRIAELEQERRWIHQDKTMIVKKDGDSWCFVLPDFKDLQRSEAKFMDVVVSGFLDKIYTNLIPQPPQEDE